MTEKYGSLRRTTGTEIPTVLLPRPLPHTLPVLLSPSRFKAVLCGRRWGKTATGLQMCLRGHGSFKGQFKGAINGGNIWWVAPDYTQIESSRIWEDLKKATCNA
jgi:hypothetical protein